MPIYFRPHSTRLFPKGDGCLQIQPTGLAARCDWVLLSDVGKPRYRLINQAGVSEPRTVFISLRGGLEAIRFFERTILRNIRSSYVLITGSEDLTIPTQTDLRWPKATGPIVESITRILNSESLVHWFAENLDAHISPKISPLPLGYVFNQVKPKHAKELKLGKPLDQREITLFCCHRVREGPQWEERRYVSELLESAEHESATVIRDEISSTTYERMLGESVFVFCVSGGGIDPCPKAFQSLQHGAIPIIRSSPMNECFRDLPVWIVNEWHEALASKEELKAKQLRFSAQMPEPHILASRLSLDYWWAVVQTACTTT